MKFYQHVLKATTPALSTILTEALQGYEKARSHKRIHASAVTNSYKQFCPREYALLDLLNKDQGNEWIDAASRVAFDIGDAYHDLVRNKWLRSIAIGNWKCKSCGYLVEFSREPKHTCPKCKSKHWFYDEMRFLHADSGMDGGIDLIVDLGLPKFTLVEIKSMDKDQFKELKMPLAEHQLRTTLYLMLVEGSDFPYKEHIDTESARVLYVSKGYGTKDFTTNKISPFRDFVVTRSDNDLAAGHCLGQARLVTAWRNSQAELPKGVCPTVSCGRAKKCAVAKECFSGEYPP